MAATSRKELELKRTSVQKLKKDGDNMDLIEKLRTKLLARGCSGILGIGSDDDGNRMLDDKEFTKTLMELSLGFSRDEIDQLFKMFDRNGSGSIDYEEFLMALQPLSASRRELVEKAFQMLDKNGDGVVKLDEIKLKYSVKDDPRFKNGEADKDQLFRQFMRTFEIGGTEDGEITRDEFFNYYAGLSASIDTDIYFDLMMRNAWKL